MKRNLYVVVAALGLSLIAGCSKPKDKAYYLENPEAAKAKLQSCEDAANKAFMDGDESQLEALEKDVECKLAAQVVAEIKQAERKAEQEAAQAKRMAEREAFISAAREKLASEHGDKDWKALAALRAAEQSNCGYHYDKENAQLNEKMAFCLVLDRKIDELFAPEKEKLLALGFDDLIAKENDFCRLKRGSGTPCAMWEGLLAESAKQTYEAEDYFTIIDKREGYCDYKTDSSYRICDAFKEVLEPKYQELLVQYRTDDALFTKTFAECYAKTQEYRSSGDYGKHYEASTNDPVCSIVHIATINRGLHENAHFDNPLP